MNSERDLRNFLNTGSLDVSGYTGELSYVSFIRRIWGKDLGTSYLFQRFCEIVEAVDDAVIIECFICV